MEKEALTTNDSSSNGELVKSRIERGCYVNSFNPEFKMPGFTTVLRWAFGAPNNTRLPADIEELNKLLPVIKHNPDEIVKTSPGLRFIWIGHASCLVQMDDFMFLTDPVFSDRCGITPAIGPKRYRPPALTVEDLPDKLEAVVISHNHYDHLDNPTVRSLNARYGNKLTWFCGLGNRQWFLDAHIENVVELDWWQEWKHPV
jgi:N-acyl-phosphatidylethanolamine-hydrolysing phospholipase D